jgi:hypothetical protein
MGTTTFLNDDIEEYFRLLALSDYYRKKADDSMNAAIRKIRAEEFRNIE